MAISSIEDIKKDLADIDTFVRETFDVQETRILDNVCRLDDDPIPPSRWHDDYWPADEQGFYQ